MTAKNPKKIAVADEIIRGSFLWRHEATGHHHPLSFLLADGLAIERLGKYMGRSYFLRAIGNLLFLRAANVLHLTIEALRIIEVRPVELGASQVAINELRLL